jgi:PKD repeat protein
MKQFKMKLLLGLVFLTTTICFFSCKKTNSSSDLPTAEFNYSGANLPAPANVSFTSTSTNATSYSWDFGDNSTGTGITTGHDYINSGVYTVKLTATNSKGSTSITKTVNIGTKLTKVKINKMQINNMPFLNSSGASWDISDGPDVYFKITDQSSNVLLDATSASRIDNLTSAMLPVYWNFTSPFVVNDLAQSRYFDLYDYDILDADDYINYAGVNFLNYTSLPNPYPNNVTFTQNGISITLDLTWY